MAARFVRRLSGRGDRVVIIGGGVSGALTAVRLAESGFDVTLVEKAKIGNGSSSRSAACIRAQWSVKETAIGMKYSEWWYCHFHEQLETPPDARQPVIRQNGYLFLYETPEHAYLDCPSPWRYAWQHAVTEAWTLAQSDALMQQTIGLPVEILDPSEVHQRWPHIEPDPIIGATWCPSDGFLYPHVIYNEGIRRAKELGVKVMTDTEVIGAVVKGRRRRIEAVETTSGLLEADWVINATNAWAPRTSERLGGMELKILPVKRYLYFLKPGKPIMNQARWESLPMTIYGMGGGRGAYSRPDGELLMMGFAIDVAPEPNFSDTDQDLPRPGFSHAQGVDNFGQTVRAEVYAFAPTLADCGDIAATTCGFYGETPDVSPLIGIDAQLENLVHAAGFSGHGLMHAPITAVLVEAIVAGRAKDGQVKLPPPEDSQFINLAAFAPNRDFTANKERKKL